MHVPQFGEVVGVAAQLMKVHGHEPTGECFLPARGIGIVHLPPSHEASPSEPIGGGAQQQRRYRRSGRALLAPPPSGAVARTLAHLQTQLLGDRGDLLAVCVQKSFVQVQHQRQFARSQEAARCFVLEAALTLRQGRRAARASHQWGLPRQRG